MVYDSDKPGPASNYPAIQDYAIIGDCRTAALISREGSLDWLCLPRFDSPSVFAALLDASRGGRFLIRPAGRFSSTRRYIGWTNVLETTFTTQTGQVRLVDLMPVASEEEKCCQLTPNHQILRAIECQEGEVEMEVFCAPRPDYARVVPKLINRGALGFFFEHAGGLFALRSDIPLERANGGSDLQGRMVFRKGERRYLSLTFAHREPAILPPLDKTAEEQITRSIHWWEKWISHCRYSGPYQNDVFRSALTLKLMTYAPSGAVVAAPTTSLPEQIGGSRNWDYRYCWLRDASMTLRALFGLGYTIEGEAFFSWLLHATRLTQPELQILYDVFGCTNLTERELSHLEGFAGSRPVRIGNAAADQLQLDTYGEVVDAAHQFVSRGGPLDRQTAKTLVGFGKTVCRQWRRPDEGIWEIRSGRQHHTYSKMMCWVALDRLLKLAEAGHLKLPAAEFTREREEIRGQIEARGYNQKLQTYVSTFEGHELDASLLLMPFYGFDDPDSKRMLQTCRRIHERLGRNGLIYRYLETEDGLAPREGAFGICSFWAVECKALQGDFEGAAASFEKVCSYANDVGLFAEEIDPETGAALGNFPQAFTHVGLINAALTLEGRAGRQAERGSKDRSRSQKAGI